MKKSKLKSVIAAMLIAACLLPMVSCDPMTGNDPVQPEQPEIPEQKDPEQKDPEQKDPEQKDPEQKDPEQKDPEQKDPEQKDPEQKDPEQKDPEQKDPEQKDPEQKDPEQKDPEQKDPEAVYHTVKFITETGAEPEIVTIKEGEVVTAPAASRTCFKFDGWYETNSSTAYNFALPVTKDTTLNAKWTKFTTEECIAYSEEVCASVREAAMKYASEHPELSGSEYYLYDTHFFNVENDPSKDYIEFQILNENKVVAKMTMNKAKDVATHPDLRWNYENSDWWFLETIDNFDWERSPGSNFSNVFGSLSEKFEEYFPTVVFYCFNEEFGAEASFQGLPVSLPEVPEVDGYEFKGWYYYDDDNNKVVLAADTTEFTASYLVELYACYEKQIEPAFTFLGNVDPSNCAAFKTELIDGNKGWALKISALNEADEYTWKIYSGQEKLNYSLAQDNTTGSEIIVDVRNYQLVEGVSIVLVATKNGVQYSENIIVRID